MKYASDQEFGTPSAELVARARVREAMIVHIDEVAWTHVAHLTHRSQSANGLWGEFRRMCRRLERQTQGRLTWFAVMEGASRQHPHLHVLFLLRGALADEALRRCWKAGDAHLERFERGRGLAAYITKEMQWDDLEYQVSWPWAGAVALRPVSRLRRPCRRVLTNGLDLGAHPLAEVG